MTFGVGVGTDLENPSVKRHMQRKQSRAGQRESGLRAVVTGLLHPDRVSRVDEQASEQIESALRARGDDDLFGAAAHAPSGVEIVGDAFAKLRVSENVVRAEQRFAAGRRPPRQQSAPMHEGELFGVGHSRMEGGVAGLADEERLLQHLESARRQLGQDLIRLEQFVSGRAKRQVDDHGPRVVAIEQIAFGQQLIVCRDHRIAPDRQVTGERAGRRQLGPRLQLAAVNHFAKQAVQLAHKRLRRPAVKNERVVQIDRPHKWFSQKSS